eukprot:CAMPEP_0114428946 /NCGR_PEP_ID=MMETSP0103-20121206/9211_1 /TAXON_ID=37642 ORGANISM="Paraphysomonas imperforata, Strain PA2" /NCGR_SAMPLE_ID=MMETSP0103 /ASSEMBLY_ACC=CAM_ASM_000201 /LENGTH=125 /DNA_ID=CAMNT_0001598225 /DNA_START=148 /DNA_END=525 /DNA_ORIENTATION=-
MAIRQDFEGKSEYFPPTYDQDGFIHATAEPKFLLQVGNNFYKSVRGDWICLKIDVTKLTSRVIYEPAMPVGDIQSAKFENEPLFPHIYGGINADSVVQVFNIIRSLDGTFHSIDNLVDAMGNVKL